jgi:hypothetical protein
MDFSAPALCAVRSELLRCLGKSDSALELAFASGNLEKIGAADAESGNFDVALYHYIQCYSAEAVYRAGLINERLGKLEASRDNYIEALLIDPTHALARVSLAYVELIRGNYRLAWELYEARWRAQTVEETEPHILSNPRWERQKNSVVLVYAEQGMGDTIHFARYAPLLFIRYDCQVYLEVQKPLVGLLQQLPHIARVFAADDEIPTDIAYVIPLLSLPRVLALNTEQELSRPTVPYLTAKPLAIDALGLRVGLCWAGGQPIDLFNLLATDRRRDISLCELDSLSGLEGFSFISLQYGHPRVQIFGSPIRFVDVPPINDFSDTAALINALDVVVTIDTAVAHLAGALGKRVLLMARFDPCWRWRNATTAKICYPMLEVFRQTKLDDWSEVVTGIGDRLIALRDSRALQ